MEYPEDFIKKVRKEFPDWEDLHEKLREGNPVIGTYLFDNLNPRDDITGEVVKRRKELYLKWWKLSQEQFPPQS